MNINLTIIQLVQTINLYITAILYFISKQLKEISILVSKNFLVEMQNQPIIEEQHQSKTYLPKIQQSFNHSNPQESPNDSSSQSLKQQDLIQDNNLKIQEDNNRLEDDNFDQSLFNLPDDLKLQEEKLKFRQRKTRWGERQIKRSKIQQDAVFNPLEALYSGNSLLPITQYGQAQLQIKMQLYSESRRRKSKWHHEIEKTFTPPMLNYISPNLSLDEVQYLLRLYRLDELTSIINDYEPQDTDLRSPSPEPIYDNFGKRINTREVRKRDQLQRERITLIEDCMKMRPNNFIPPQDYKPLKKFKKIYLTEQALNDSKANYIGRIIGPEGKTQKIIQKRSGCKIAVRGRGANKKQKDIFENYEPLHVIIVADNDEMLDKGVEEVQKLLNGEQDEEIKAMLEGLNSQLMGIFNDNYCDNCQQEGHRTWACPFGAKNKVQITCSICGQSSHPTSDCPQKQAYLKKQQTNQIAMLLESQYDQFRSDLEQKPKGGIAFITDIDRKKLLAIGQDPSNPTIDQQAQTFSSNQVTKAKKAVEEEIQTRNLPRFQDD